ncbi:hypothetical protein GIS00_06615 [Nakamurella sp. YIM 132087]|uniref:DUF4333 domain-containing protein n=1 Tax=Nakamurella alba TaxID=2665158 RepID=A0A7K1FHL6_9ACTN|nr:hypothetical protein [Nakamurella alba]MTD13615.1 hypothetical protein [Nakamurella alba]
MRSRLLGVLATLLVLAGCSQAAALAPVGGNRPTLVRFAALDVLVEKKVDLMTAPVCTMTGRDVSCAGETVDGAQVVVTSSADDEQRMMIAVGEATIFEGSIQDVLDAGARPTS